MCKFRTLTYRMNPCCTRATILLRRASGRRHKADIGASLWRQVQRDSGGGPCVISMLAMSATFSNSRFYASLLAQTARSALRGTTRQETMGARTDDISNGATKRHGVCSTLNFTWGSLPYPSAALPPSNRQQFGPRAHCFTASRCRLASSGAHGQQARCDQALANCENAPNRDPTPEWFAALILFGNRGMQRGHVSREA